MISIERRFLGKVRVGEPDDCWEWCGGVFTRGYGLFWMNHKNRKAHRVAYEFAHGEIPEGLSVCHHCDNPLCCNPAHLFLGTAKDNTRDMINKGRADFTSLSNSDAKSRHHKVESREVIKIREMYSTGKHTLKELGDIFGLSIPGVHHIVKRETWKHL